MGKPQKEEAPKADPKAAASKEKAEAPKKAVVPKQPSQNGVTRPKDGTKTGDVWKIADTISENVNRPATRKEVLAECVGKGINTATGATQYGRWRKFHGLAAEVKAPKAEAKAAEAPAE